MQQWPDGFVDLCYLDPPFNSKTNYNVLFGKQRNNIAQALAFTDTWHWDDPASGRVNKIKKAVGHLAHRSITGLHTILGDCGMMAYLSYMAERLVEIRRVLKPTGSMYLHCDPTASHYLKVILDEIFGRENFRNEIIWCYTTPANVKRYFPRKTDTILFYVKSEKSNYTFNHDDVRVPYKRGSKLDGKGWDTGITYSKEEINKGKLVTNWWGDITPVQRLLKEMMGYPTQKPVALLKRIIKASSNKGDLVLDPFCGCGTTIYAADESNRNWIGIDISPYAVDLICKRRFKHKINVNGIPTSIAGAERLVKDNPFDFEKWAITCIPGMLPNSKQRGDGGVDGRGTVYNYIQGSKGLVLAQVKGGHFSLSQLRDFLHTVNREKATFGVFITLNEVTSPQARTEVQTAGKITIGANSYNKVQLWSIEDYFNKQFVKLPPLADPYTGKGMQPSLLNQP